jgi:hypothetical protein
MINERVRRGVARGKEGQRKGEHNGHGRASDAHGERVDERLPPTHCTAEVRRERLTRQREDRGHAVGERRKVKKVDVPGRGKDDGKHDAGTKHDAQARLAIGSKQRTAVAAVGEGSVGHRAHILPTSSPSRD